jgi:hypothetical protein
LFVLFVEVVSFEFDDVLIVLFPFTLTPFPFPFTPFTFPLTTPPNEDVEDRMFVMEFLFQT